MATVKKRPIPLRLLAFAGAVLAALAGGTGASAETEGGGANQAVIAIATADDSSLSRSGLQVASAGGPTVDSDNVATAMSHDCTGCTTVAVAFQAVLVTGDPNTVTPDNIAAATNERCTRCGSFAYAYQYVLSAGGPVYLSPEGRDRVNLIREEAAEAAASGLSFPEIDARLDTLTVQFKAVIDSELADGGANGVESRRVEVSPAS